jgi:hypothetical protein
VGHGERDYDDLSKAIARGLPRYQLVKVDLDRGDDPVDPTLAALIVGASPEGISEKELRRIDAYLMTGKSVGIFENDIGLKVGWPDMSAKLDKSRIGVLLSGYGLTLRRELLADTSQPWRPQGGKAVTPQPLVMIAKELDKTFAPFADVDRIPVPFPLELAVDSERAKRSGAEVRIALQTSSTLTTVQGTSVMLNPAPDKLGSGAASQRTEKRRATVAVALDGTIGSAFGDTTAPKSARLFVIASGAFLGNPYRQGALSPFGDVPGGDPTIGMDEALIPWAERYEPLHLEDLAIATKICAWLTHGM